jgi:hypothetical protein
LRDQRNALDRRIEQRQLVGKRVEAAGAMDDVLDGLEVIGSRADDPFQWPRAASW